MPGYDTVTMWLEHHEARGALSALSELQTFIDNSTGEVAGHRGKLRNLRVKVTGNGLSVNGSLAKFFLGNNLESLNKQTTAIALESLSDHLHLPMDEATIFRLDIGENLNMREPLIAYTSQLGDARHYKKSEFANRQTVLYKNSMRSLTFYPKLVEMRSHKESIPEAFIGQNLLRYEARYTARIAKQLNRPLVRASDLIDEDFYARLLQRWKEEYFSIHKLHRPTGEINVENTRQFLRSLAMIGLKYIGGEETALEAVRAARSKGKLDKMQAYRLRATVRELASAENLTESSDAILELDERIREAATTHH